MTLEPVQGETEESEKETTGRANGERRGETCGRFRTLSGVSSNWEDDLAALPFKGSGRYTTGQNDLRTQINITTSVFEWMSQAKLILDCYPVYIIHATEVQRDIFVSSKKRLAPSPSRYHWFQAVYQAFNQSFTLQSMFWSELHNRHSLNHTGDSSTAVDLGMKPKDWQQRQFKFVSFVLSSDGDDVVLMNPMTLCVNIEV